MAIHYRIVRGIVKWKHEYNVLNINAMQIYAFPLAMSDRLHWPAPHAAACSEKTRPSCDLIPSPVSVWIFSRFPPRADALPTIRSLSLSDRIGGLSDNMLSWHPESLRTLFSSVSWRLRPRVVARLPPSQRFRRQVIRGSCGVQR